MKKAYLVVNNNGSTFNNLEAGTIVAQCYLGETMGDLENNVILGDLVNVNFDDEIIDSAYIKSELIEGNWVIVEDEEKKLQDISISTEKRKMEYGKEVLAYIGVLFNSLTVEDYQTLLLDQEIAMMQNLLRQGALESTLGLLDGYAVNAIVTQEIKTKIASKIAFYIAQV